MSEFLKNFAKQQVEKDKRLEEKIEGKLKTVGLNEATKATFLRMPDMPTAGIGAMSGTLSLGSGSSVAAMGETSIVEGYIFSPVSAAFKRCAQAQTGAGSPGSWRSSISPQWAGATPFANQCKRLGSGPGPQWVGAAGSWRSSVGPQWAGAA